LTLLNIGDFIQSPQTVIHQFDRLINIRLLYSISEVELCHSLRDSYDSEQCSWGDVHVAGLFFSFPLLLSFFNIFCDDVLMKSSWNIWIESLCFCNEISHCFLINVARISFWGLKLLMD
jgi:hypothetical protein